MTRGLPKVGDVVLTVEAPLGEVAQITSERIALAQRIILLRGKTDFLDNSYLKYFLISDLGQSQLGSRSSGTTVFGIKQSELRKIKIIFPSFEEQKAIAKILSSLDDKIELNRRMNATLEAMAKALFKAWFVDFEPVRANLQGLPSESASPKIAKIFPSEFENDIPKDWRNIKLEELIEIKHGYAFSGEFITDKENENILLTPGNFRIGGGFNNSKFKYFSGQPPESYILERNDLIVTMTDLSKNGDTLGYPALVPNIQGKKLLHNQRLGKVITKTDLPLKLFLYLLMIQTPYKEFVLGSSTGSTVRHTSPKRICDYKIILPSQEILIEFDRLVKHFILKEQENSFENQQLAEIRDSLLPRLISGKIRVGEAKNETVQSV